MERMPACREQITASLNRLHLLMQVGHGKDASVPREKAAFLNRLHLLM
jgi:hypothetical protein